LLRTALPALMAALSTFVSASAQFPFGGAPTGPGTNPMGDLMERVAFGAIEDANPVMGYIQVGVPGRGSRIVIAHEATAITQMAPIGRGELKAGDEVVVTGMPTVVVAERVQIGAALSMMDLMRALQGPPPSAPAGAEGAPAPTPPAPTAPETPAPAGPPTGGAAAGVTLTGHVRTTDPLVLTLGDGSELAVQLPDGAPILRRTEADLSALVLGDAIVALGQLDEDGYLLADRIYLGESVSMGRSGGRGGRGGGFGGPPMGGGEGP